MAVRLLETVNLISVLHPLGPKKAKAYTVLRYNAYTVYAFIMGRLAAEIIFVVSEEIDYSGKNGVVYSTDRIKILHIQSP